MIVDMIMLRQGGCLNGVLREGQREGWISGEKGWLRMRMMRDEIGGGI